MNEIIVKNASGELEVPKKIINAIQANEEKIKAAKAENDDFKEQLKAAMEEYGDECTKISSVKASVRVTLK